MASEARKQPCMDIYAPRVKGDFSTLALSVDKALSHARQMAARRGFQSGSACVFSEDAIYAPYSARLSDAKLLAERLQKRLPKDQFFAIGFCVAVKDGLDGRNEGFLVTSEGWQSAPKRGFTPFDCETIVRMFGKCDFKEMFGRFEKIQWDSSAAGLPFCQANAAAGLCMKYRSCDCPRIEAIWAGRKASASFGSPVLRANGKNGIAIEYCVCADVALAPAEKLCDTVTLVSAHGLFYHEREYLGQKRLTVAVNDSFQNRGLLLEPRHRAASWDSIKDGGWQCDVASIY